MPKTTRPVTLITIEGVKSLIEKGIGFRCRYELIGRSPDGKPKYSCYYLSGGEEALLVQSRISANGPETRTFTLWPGLFSHHQKYGDGSTLCYHKDERVSCVKREAFEGFSTDICL